MQPGYLGTKHILHGPGWVGSALSFPTRPEEGIMERGLQLGRTLVFRAGQPRSAGAVAARSRQSPAGRRRHDDLDLELALGEPPQVHRRGKPSSLDDNHLTAIDEYLGARK